MTDYDHDGLQAQSQLDDTILTELTLPTLAANEFSRFWRTVKLASV